MAAALNLETASQGLAATRAVEDAVPAGRRTAVGMRLAALNRLAEGKAAMALAGEPAMARPESEEAATHAAAFRTAYGDPIRERLLFCDERGKPVAGAPAQAAVRPCYGKPPEGGNGLLWRVREADASKGRER